MNKSLQIKRIIGLGVLGALVAVLQLIKIPLGVFSITLSLAPIVIGAVLYGPKGGAFLGFIMGIVVLFVDSALFYAINAFGTILVVLLKSTIAGLVAGLIFKALQHKNQNIGIILSSLATPIINTGIFLLGCFIFFFPALQEMAMEAGVNVMTFIFVNMIGLNFIVEMAINVLLAPSIIYIIKTISKNYDLGSNLE